MPMNTAEMNHFQDIYDALDHDQTDEAMRLICQEQQKQSIRQNSTTCKVKYS